MGFVSIFLSEPLVSGYTTGVAILVFTSQVSHIFGIKLTIHPLISRFPDILNFPRVSDECGSQVARAVALCGCQSLFDESGALQAHELIND